MKRRHLQLQGIVQGVGFRPTVYRLAKTLGLTGWVCNDAQGLRVEIQGTAIDEFLPLLEKNLPSLARIESISSKDRPLCPEASDFVILASQDGAAASTRIAPDTASCEACLQEVLSPASRYYQYPFVNCTHCGPRFSILHRLPYDRAQTSMADFPFCEACAQEYHDPTNRRYHAQPTACAACGPHYTASIATMAQNLAEGQILAVKSLGGYQLISNARQEASILRLRQRKQRDAKPLALMTANLEAAARIVMLDTEAAKLLDSKEKPIVILDKTDDSLPAGIAPGLRQLGIMLPYTPFHRLLFEALTKLGMPDPVLIVTSANSGGEPLITDDTEAAQKLAAIADKVIPHQRAIVNRLDDSVVRLVDGAPLFIRRARGYVPEPIRLARELPPILALGGYLKNTFCLTRGNEAFVSQHIGSLNNRATLRFYHETLDRWCAFLGVIPQYLAHDAHPDFYSSQFAEKSPLPAFAVQHHHAHLASVMAEYQLEKPTLGLALDGYGYGPNGEAWGGELLLLNGADYQRISGLYPLPQPGGDQAAREPWRMAAGVLALLERGSEITHRFGRFPQAALLQQYLADLQTPPVSSSAGRLFDAAAALLGVCLVSSYEGQAAMELESLVTQPTVLPNGWQKDAKGLSLLPTLAKLADMHCPREGANLFHGTLIAALSDCLIDHCREQKKDVLVLAGGCFLNRILSEGLIHTLAQAGIKALLPRRLPPNDGGLALGQAWIAGLLKG